ncbi:unnamed protein product [Calypogeia fissa]
MSVAEALQIPDLQQADASACQLLQKTVDPEDQARALAIVCLQCQAKGHTEVHARRVNVFFIVDTAMQRREWKRIMSNPNARNFNKHLPFCADKNGYLVDVCIW